MLLLTTGCLMPYCHSLKPVPPIVLAGVPVLSPPSVEADGCQLEEDSAEGCLLLNEHYTYSEWGTESNM